MTDTVKYVLDESRIPKAWYNLQADLPKPLPPVLPFDFISCAAFTYHGCRLRISFAIG